MIAALPMYDRPETAGAHDAFWAAIRDGLRAGGHGAPETLTRGLDLWEGWEHPDLVLGQTCGLPYRARLHGKVTLVATPDYGLEDTAPGHYRSLFVTRRGDDRDIASYGDRLLAYNEDRSHSGWSAPQITAGERGFAFARALRTGSHAASAAALAEGRADIAAIDAVTWRMLLAHAPGVTDRLQVIDRTLAAPGLAYICAPDRDPAPLRAAIGAALKAGHGAALGITGLVTIPAESYLAVPTPPAPQQASVAA